MKAGLLQLQVTFPCSKGLPPHLWARLTWQVAQGRAVGHCPPLSSSTSVHVGMYICTPHPLHMQTYIDVHGHTHARMQAHMHTCTHHPPQTHTYTQVHTDTDMHTMPAHTRANTPTSTCPRSQAHRHRCIHIPTHMHTSTSTSTPTHTIKKKSKP